MKLSPKVAVLSWICALLLSGCGKSGKAMPLTKENLTEYQHKVEAAVKSTTPREFKECGRDPLQQKKVIYLCIVEPIEQMGYSYDKTIADLAGKVLAKDLGRPDQATAVMLGKMLRFAGGAREMEYQLGFISGDTKLLLDRVNLRSRL